MKIILGTNLFGRMVWTQIFEYIIISLFFILTWCSLVSFADVVRDSLWYDAEFSVMNDGRNMDEVIMHVNDVNFEECTLYCVKHLKCKSVNYNEEKQMCEICDSEFDEEEALLDDKRWKNYGTPSKQHGKYSKWIDGQCSVTCGIGEKIRYRRCNDPPPRYGGDDCKGPYLQTVRCHTVPCPVHGNWNTWSNFSTCSKTCGQGKAIRNRTCDNPFPKYGGDECKGSKTEEKVCKMKPCPIHGNWNTWSNFSTCSKTCGQGKAIRNRTCDNPFPKYGGDECKGSKTEEKVCKMKPCPIDGDYTAWGTFARCSRSCGIGKQIRRRNCTNPPPKHGGKNCTLIGKSYEVQGCTLKECPVHGIWNTWSAYGTCSKTCGPGKAFRSRNCTNPPPAHGGDDCNGKKIEERPCEEKVCLPPLKYYIKESGECKSLSKEDCKRYYNESMAGLWEEESESSGVPGGCYHEGRNTDNGVVFFNTHPKATGECTEWLHCVCLPPEYRKVAKKRCMSVTLEDCRQFSDSINAIWRGTEAVGGGVHGCYLNKGNEVYFNEFTSSSGHCSAWAQCVCVK